MIFEQINQFMHAGGEVLYLIALVSFILWLLIIERFCCFFWVLPEFTQQRLAHWQARDDMQAWYAMQIKRRLASEVDLAIQHHMSVIKTLIALCPLLGLLGTVWGMIEVFNALSLTAGDAKAMAAGVSKATIPTMAGMVAALSAMFANTFLERIANQQSLLFKDSLVSRS